MPEPGSDTPRESTARELARQAALDAMAVWVPAKPDPTIHSLSTVLSTFPAGHPAHDMDDLLPRINLLDVNPWEGWQPGEPEKW